jgi:hypothetical protein
MIIIFNWHTYDIRQAHKMSLAYVIGMPLPNTSQF